MRACNDLGYMASMLRNAGHEVFLKDYKIEEKTALDLLDDVLEFAPNIVVFKTDINNIFEDLKLVRMIKSSNPQIIIVLSSEIFFDASEDLLCNLPMGGVDYLIGSDEAFVMPLLIQAHYESPELLYQVPFITICRNGMMHKTNFHAPHGNINDLPFPARDLMNNKKYIRPDNKQPIATIITATGCNSKCIHCSEPVFNDYGCSIRPAKKVFEEVVECFEKYNIQNFYFPSDMFTNSEKWVEEFCDYIIESPLNGKINWIANINVSSITEYMAMEMQKAGCTIVLMRFESGSDNSLSKMQKDFSADECYNAAEIIKKQKLKIFGLFSIGLPWETESDLAATRGMILKINPNYLSLALPVAYPDSIVEKHFREENILREPVIQKEMIKIPELGTKFLTHEKLIKFRRKTLLLYYISPKYLWKKFAETYKKPSQMKEFLIFVWNLLKKQ
jgi:radical SAM superfamily enzyme YgiQ (UPF0313 family)